MITKKLSIYFLSEIISILYKIILQQITTTHTSQKQAMLVRQLEEELRMRMRQPNIEMQQQMEAIFSENEHLTREIAILRDTIKVGAAVTF